RVSDALVMLVMVCTRLQHGSTDPHIRFPPPLLHPLSSPQCLSFSPFLAAPHAEKWVTGRLAFAVAIVTAVALASGGITAFIACSITFSLALLLIVGYFIEALQIG
ncbi:hypothetical protein F5148DRAFT_1172519, partial [Russula earlei]